MITKVIVIPSPNAKKKFRAVFEDGTHIDFGGAGYSDYTLHKTPARMRNYVRRHGGMIPARTEALETPKAIDEAMLRVKKSSSEEWGKRGIKTAGFWSRWLLWSGSSLEQAKKRMESLFNLKITLKRK